MDAMSKLGSASARGADAGASALEIGRKEAEADCGHISASQTDLLARAHFGAAVVVEEEVEVFSTPPLTLQDTQRQGQSQQGQAGEGEDGIAMCSLPFTQTPTPTPAPTPTPTPAPAATASPRPNPELDPLANPDLDPLVRAVLMIPTAPLPTIGHKDFLELAKKFF